MLGVICNIEDSYSLGIISVMHLEIQHRQFEDGNWYLTSALELRSEGGAILSLLLFLI